MKPNGTELKKSETFCPLPWIHLHVSPSGLAAPCCISYSASTVNGVGDSKTQELIEIVNSDQMNKLRLDMLSGVKNKECETCYNHEAQGISSFRQHSINDHTQYLDTILDDTNLQDGSLSKFKMRYFDIRFSNICNFKCRTCGSGFSSQWEQEDIKSNVSYARIVPKNNNKKFLQDILEQIDYMETAYFAGGEPLITEEHYIMLEEMIRRGRTDIKLKYNTNLSSLKFKDKDLLSLWKHFSKKIYLSASIDHYGEKAEYIRHGTDWGAIESNFKIIKNIPYIELQTNTVLSVFNYMSLYEFYQYMIDNQMLHPVIDKYRTYSIYNMSAPTFLSCHILPTEYKIRGKENIEKLLKVMKNINLSDKQISIVENTIPWAFSQDTWEQEKQKFREEIDRVDKLRGENFSKVFPELAGLLDD